LNQNHFTASHLSHSQENPMPNQHSICTCADPNLPYPVAAMTPFKVIRLLVAEGYHAVIKKELLAMKSYTPEELSARKLGYDMLDLLKAFAERMIAAAKQNRLVWLPYGIMIETEENPCALLKCDVSERGNAWAYCL